MDKQKGFTLIEMMVAISIIAIVTGVTLSTYLTMRPKLRVSGAARQIQGDLMWAKMQAVKQNNRFRIIFLDDHQYQILDDDNNDGAETAGELIVTKDIQTNYGDVTFNPVPGQFPIFDPMGRLYWPIGITISLQNSSGTKSVSVASTGRVIIN
ncbi:MAG: prepilin-type N-terminal cleavage/methylation domain-containing protein [Planctomycetes bacterium]|nr:prepilin-type N-terminal cleavage/methylation domain-containing protein [Planctomycetota bacterium]